MLSVGQAAAGGFNHAPTLAIACQRIVLWPLRPENEPELLRVGPTKPWRLLGLFYSHGLDCGAVTLIQRGARTNPRRLFDWKNVRSRECKSGGSGG